MASDECVRSEDAPAKYLRFPVVSEGAEHLVMGYLMRRNILTYKAPPLNEGYDLICIHPDPRRRPQRGTKSQLRIQVKSRYSTNAQRGFPIKSVSLNAFDYLIVVFLNIGNFARGMDGLEGAAPPEFYTLPRRLIRKWHNTNSSWEKVDLRGKQRTLERYRDESGFELIAEELGIARPSRSALRSE